MQEISKKREQEEQIDRIDREAEERECERRLREREAIAEMSGQPQEESALPDESGADAE